MKIELSGEELRKAATSCSVESSCAECPLRDMDGCTEILVARLTEVVEEQQRTIEHLMRYPMQACKLCTKRDAECTVNGYNCQPEWIGHV